MGRKHQSMETYIIVNPFWCTRACACGLILNCAPEIPRKPSYRIKMSKRTLINSKFFDDTPIVACSLQIEALAIQTPSFAAVTPLWNLNQDEKSSRSHTVYYHQLCEMQYKISWSTLIVYGLHEKVCRLQSTAGATSSLAPQISFHCSIIDGQRWGRGPASWGQFR